MSTAPIMNTIKKPLHIVGVSTITSNELAQTENSIGKLWAHFLNINIKEMLESLASPSIFSVYSHYENDYHGKYTVTIGYAVPDISNIPRGLSIVIIPAGNYKKFESQNNSPEAIVDVWKTIWSTDPNELHRNFIADFEEYHADDVSIYVGYDDY